MTYAPMPPGFIKVTGLYEKQDKQGRTLYAGAWHKKRLYVFVDESDGEPAFWLCVRAEDYSAAETP